ncbi:MAG: MFS transporter [Vitreoscilla sp.]|nr:MFS transporter [Vitreoscilla sp.]
MARRWTPFERVLGAELVSNFGSMLSRLAIPWLAALALDATPWQMGWLLVADVVAGALGSLVLGAWVDRRPLRSVMVWADLWRAALLLALAGLAWHQWLTWWLLVLAAAASGLLGVAFELARSAWIARASEAEALAGRNAALSASGSVAEALAFGLGGWLYQGLGAVVALAVDGVSYLVSAACLRGVPEAEPGGTPTEARTPTESLTPAIWWAGTRAGWQAVWADAALRQLAVIEALVAAGMSLAGTSYMIFVTRDLGFAPGPLGMMFALGSLGALAGAALAPRLGRRWGPGPAMGAGLAAMSLGGLAVALAPDAGLLGAALLISQQIVGDAGHTVRDVHDRTWRQSAAPPGMQASVDGGLRAVGHAATLLGALGGGALATALGTRSALLGSAALLGLAAVCAVRRLR